MMKIYTKTGDKGTTGLFGGTRIPKSSVRLHAYGTLDELNACLGVIGAEADVPEDLRTQLTWIQTLLFSIGADLATPLESKANIKRMTEEPALQLEQWIDVMEETLPPLTTFILPSGSRVGALLHEARTVCRRAERWIVELHEKEKITDAIIVITNRLSDYLFVAARYANKKLGKPETQVEIPR
jgi:cob(I)alamin adenosyltransferase